MLSAVNVEHVFSVHVGSEPLNAGDVVDASHVLLKSPPVWDQHVLHVVDIVVPHTAGALVPVAYCWLVPLNVP